MRAIAGLRPIPKRETAYAAAATLAAVAVAFGVTRVGYVVLGVALLAFLLAMSASALSVTGTVVLLVVLPDSPALTHVGAFSVTPRVGALIFLLIHSTFFVIRRHVIPRVTYKGIWMLFVLVVVAGAIRNHRLQSIALFLLFAFLPYVAGATLGVAPEAARAIVRGLVVGALILSLVAIIEFLRHKPFFAPVSSSTVYTDYTRAGNLRANAGWIHPLALGMFLCLTAFLVIDHARRRGQGASVAAALIIAAAIFATQERSPLIGLAAGALVYVIVQASRGSRRRAVVIVLIVLLGVLAFPGPHGTAFRQFLGESFGGAQSPAAIDVSARVQILRLGINVVKQSPLVGFGFGATSNVPANPALLAGFSTSSTSFTDVANWPLSVAVETGLGGLALLLCLITANLSALFRRRTRPSAVPIPALMASLTAALVTSIGVNQPTTAALFMFVLGLGSTTGTFDTRLVRQVSKPTSRNVAFSPQGMKAMRALGPR